MVLVPLSGSCKSVRDACEPEHLRQTFTDFGGAVPKLPEIQHPNRVEHAAPEGARGPTCWLEHAAPEGAHGPASRFEGAAPEGARCPTEHTASEEARGPRRLSVQTF